MPSGPLKLLIEQHIAAGLPGNAPSLHLALGRRSPILQRGSLWLAHRVVRAFAIVLLLLGAMGINMLMTHNTSTGTVETTGQSGAVSPR
jgi:hypothetical protein